ncbi:ester cyclase [Phycobacter azelaicus]|jgi:ketosteroid isomerase-like protein|uniref:ester cyclase n=1 Tax=Phycobacter azelaicus TaxID=2668075 RepID=UPI001865BE83|nr:ester cyclase [Phycobacter azelaicus]
MSDFPSSNFDVVKQWFNTLWEKADIAAIQDLAQTDISIEGQITALGGSRQDYADMVMTLNRLLDNISFEYEHVMECGELVAAKLLVRAQSAVTKSDIRFSGHFIARVEDGKLTELSSTIDYMKMFEQLGQLPEESLAICLTGERLVWGS